MILATALLAAAGTMTHAAAPTDAVPLFTDLGSYHRAISTKNPTAQKYFDQGLRLVYGFNHDEAERAFREAARLDPACAICYWGRYKAESFYHSTAQDYAGRVLK